MCHVRYACVPTVRDSYPIHKHSEGLHENMCVILPGLRVLKKITVRCRLHASGGLPARISRLRFCKDLLDPAGVSYPILRPEKQVCQNLSLV